MKRGEMLQSLAENIHWDIIIIGGGATGLGTAVDAASRGFKTLLLEQHDFAKGTSSRSTKLLHGGVRYLAQGNFKLVMEALRERGYLLRNAPHINTTCSFVIPVYKWWEKWYYGAGLVFYDLLAGKLGLGNTKMISKKSTEALLPTLKLKNLKAGILYKDGQFDDTRLAINLAQTATEQGATVLNYCKVTRLTRNHGKMNGVILTDTINRKEYSATSRVIINATGVFVDAVMAMDEPNRSRLVSPSQGVHIVLDKKFFPGKAAMMIPQTTDGRVLFAVPWHDKVVVGTTDTQVEKISPEPEPLQEEINFILQNLNAYLGPEVRTADVLSVFAGLRPLVRMSSVHKTALMPRDHTILLSRSGLITITGGKWTTYRKMAADVVNKAIHSCGLKKTACVTQALKIHGWVSEVDSADPLGYYGADLEALKELYEEDNSWRELLHPLFPYTKACVIRAVRQEMAMTTEDVLARRTRMLFLDARAAMESVSTVASLMAQEMEMDDLWIRAQVNSFTDLAKRYLPG
jgi:glycerol-3-phosphate dehydrogenase